MKKRIRILLVDDHSLLRNALEAILQLEEDFQTIAHASCSSVALAEVRAHPPDLVLLDRRMPDGDGFDLLIEVRKIAPNIRVIMMTASARAREVEQSRALEAAGHPPKNVRRDALIKAIRKLTE